MNELIRKKFLELVDSLRKHQRAELLNEKQENIIEYLYADPLEGNFVLESMMFPNTTILIGRKGTGKSTIINRFQHEIRKTSNQLALYLDVKSIFYQSRDSVPEVNNVEHVLTNNEIQKMLLYKQFFNNIVNEIISEINNSVFTNKIIKFITSRGVTEKDFKARLDKIFKDVLNPKFEDYTAIKNIKIGQSKKNSVLTKTDSSSKSEISPKVSISKEGAGIEIGKIAADNSDSTSEINDTITAEEYSSVFVRYFNIVEFMNEIKKLLTEVGIIRVFICLDDASELEEESLDIFMRTLVVPLHTTSNEFFRFKISFYPGRDRLPDIDRTKIETINLDYYYLYQSSGIDKVEENALKYTKKLLETRFKYYFGNNVNLDDFFDTRGQTIDDYYKIIFQASANVPRLIGKLLWFAAKRSINQGEKITKKVLQDASKEHYINEIETILYRSEYIQYKNFSEKFEKIHLMKLVELFIDKAKENKRHIGQSDSEIFRIYNPNNAPSNYLYFYPELERVVATLELNFFITKYSQQKDKGRMSNSGYEPPKEISIYTLNYGLCQKENIIVDEKSDRKFRIERIFDFTKLITEWANSSKRIICENCKYIHPFEKYEAIKSLGMICTNCGQKKCILETIAIDIPQKHDYEIPQKEFEVLNTLNVESPLTASQIGEDLDCSYQAINPRVKENGYIRSKGLIKREKEGKYPLFYITEEGKAIFK